MNSFKNQRINLTRSIVCSYFPNCDRHRAVGGGGGREGLCIEIHKSASPKAHLDSLPTVFRKTNLLFCLSKEGGDFFGTYIILAVNLENL